MCLLFRFYARIGAGGTREAVTPARQPQGEASPPLVRFAVLDVMTYGWGGLNLIEGRAETVSLVEKWVNGTRGGWGLKAARGGRSCSWSNMGTQVSVSG